VFLRMGFLPKSMMNKSHFINIGFGASIAASLAATPAQAEMLITENIAQTQAIPINLTSGQISSIHFQNGYRISYLILSDRSKIVYSLNAPTESGEARSIFLRQIDTLSFPGETTSNQPDLRVVAIDNRGNQRNYKFIVDNSQEHESDITIVPPPNKPRAKKTPNVIYTDLGAATPEDIRIGLKYKLDKGEVAPEDPIALYTSEAIAITLNEQKTLLALSKELNIPLSVLSEFGRTGLAQKTKFRLQQANREEARRNQLSLKMARRSLIKESINRPVIKTDLGEATVKDINFGLSVMLEREYITDHEAQEINEILQQVKANNQNLSEQDKAKIQRVARLGLAFNARLRIFGTLD
jgi:hypothetical protein